MRCCLCDDFLEGRYLKHSFFETEKYCVFHQDQRRVCYACARLEPLPTKKGREGFVALPDGRFSCPHCIMTAVMDSNEARPLYLEAVDFMERVLGLRIPSGMREVPVLAVDVPSLNEQKEQSDRAQKRNVATVRGLTLYTTSVQTVTHVTYMPSGQLQRDPRTGQLVTVVQPLQRISLEHLPTREVTAVLVLFGLPRDLTASILAHEAMHVYFKLSGSGGEGRGTGPGFPVDLQPQCEEGLCQLVAERYLADREQRARFGGGGGGGGGGAGSTKPPTMSSVISSATSTASPTQADSDSEARDARLREYFQFAIHSDRSDVYGYGFRAAHTAVLALGLEVVLEHVRHTRALPVV